MNNNQNESLLPIIKEPLICGCPPMFPDLKALVLPMRVGITTPNVKTESCRDDGSEIKPKPNAGVGSSDLLGHGSKFKIVVTLDAELVTETDGVTQDQICDMILRDEAYGLKSIVVGKINPDSEDDHDTEIIWDSTTVRVDQRPNSGTATNELVRITEVTVEEAVSSLTSVIKTFSDEALDSTKIINTLAAVDQAFAISSKDLIEALKRVGNVAD